MACGQALSADNNSKGEAGEMTKRPAVETLLIAIDSVITRPWMFEVCLEENSTTRRLSKSMFEKTYNDVWVRLGCWLRNTPMLLDPSPWSPMRC